MLRGKADNGREGGLTHPPGLRPFSSLKQLRKNKIRTLGFCSFLAHGPNLHPPLPPSPFSCHPQSQQGSSLAIIPGWEMRTYKDNQLLNSGQEERVLRGATYQAPPAASL